MRAAVFSDVEGTLVTTSIPRLSFSLGRKIGLFSARQSAETFALNGIAQLLPGRLKRSLQIYSIARAMAGQSEEEVRKLLDVLTPAVMQHLKPEMLARLRAHQEAGLPLVLVSAGPHEAVARVGDELGGRGEGTRLVFRDDQYTARLDGPACQGEGKAERARRVLAELDADPALSYAYGDTASDISFLALFGHPCAVDPDRELAAEAARRGWPILRTSAGTAAAS